MFKVELHDDNRDMADEYPATVDAYCDITSETWVEVLCQMTHFVLSYCGYTTYPGVCDNIQEAIREAAQDACNNDPYTYRNTSSNDLARTRLCD